MQIGESRVKKILVGDKVVYQDSDGWIPLELPDGVSGNVFFKDYSNGTAGLIGSISFSSASDISSIYAKGHAMLNAPTGYKFVDANWLTSGSSNKAISTLGNLYNDTQSPSVVGSAYVSFLNGNILASKVVCYASVTNSKVVISFNRSSTDTKSEVVDWASPAIVSIEKI